MSHAKAQRRKKKPELLPRRTAVDNLENTVKEARKMVSITNRAISLLAVFVLSELALRLRAFA
jgi:hypothetical protein